MIATTGGTRRARCSRARRSATPSGCRAGCSSRSCAGSAVHLIDVWDPDMVLDVMRRGRPLRGQRLHVLPHVVARLPEVHRAHHRSIKQVGMGGSAIPAAVAERARGLGIKLVRSYGSTEHPSTTGSTLDDPRRQAQLHRRQRRCRAWRCGSSTTTGNDLDGGPGRDLAPRPRSVRRLHRPDA